ncbi:hypothetical protein [Spongiactinospora sp. 9N601]
MSEQVSDRPPRVDHVPGGRPQVHPVEDEAVGQGDSGTPGVRGEAGG